MNYSIHEVNIYQSDIDALMAGEAEGDFITAWELLLQSDDCKHELAVAEESGEDYYLLVGEGDHFYKFLHLNPQVIEWIPSDEDAAIIEILDDADEGYRCYIVRYDDTGGDILHVTSVTRETDTDKWCARAMEFERE